MFLKILALYESPNEPQVCSVCNLKCPNVHDLIKHRSENHAPKKFQCLVCGIFSKIIYR